LIKTLFKELFEVFMFPTSGQQVKCFFRNGFIAEGIVENWSAAGAQLKSLDEQSCLIINNPSSDIVMIKVSLKNRTINNLKNSIKIESVENMPATDPFSEEYNKSLVQLRKEKAEMERRIISEKLKEHRPSHGIGKVKYEQPGFNT